MGFAFALGIVAASVHSPKERPSSPLLLDWIAVGASVLIPLSMSVWPQAAGLLQRLMFAVAFAWYGAQAWRATK